MEHDENGKQKIKDPKLELNTADPSYTRDVNRHTDQTETNEVQQPGETAIANKAEPKTYQEEVAITCQKKKKEEKMKPEVPRQLKGKQEKHKMMRMKTRRIT